jgi:hypothetical protein
LGKKLVKKSVLWSVCLSFIKLFVN